MAQMEGRPFSLAWARRATFWSKRPIFVNFGAKLLKNYITFTCYRSFVDRWVAEIDKKFDLKSYLKSNIMKSIDWVSIDRDVYSSNNHVREEYSPRNRNFHCFSRNIDLPVVFWPVARERGFERESVKVYNFKLGQISVSSWQKLRFFAS